jgi:hypothetical protein
MAAANPEATAPTASPASAPPTIEIRFPALYAWMLVGFGVIFFFLGLLVGRRVPPLGILISVASLAAIIGGHYWRNHLHVVARMTPRLLVLRREGSVKWTDIAEIEKKTIAMRNRGVRHQSAYVCIKLAKPRPARPGVGGFLDNVKHAVLGGYDIVVPDSELSCTADWFIAECQKRMAVAPR